MRGILFASLCVYQAVAGVARAAHSSEFWPEISGFVPLSPRTRAYLDAAYLDISLKPIRRRDLWTEDWQRRRHFWARIGYDRIFKETSETAGYVGEDRGIVSFYGKAPLAAEIWLDARARADLRWIGDDCPTRYRFRIEATRGFTVLNRTVVPCFNVEWFYDTRYGGWARTLYQLGPEITANQHFRYEIHLARQDDRHPTEETLNALGFVAKWHL